MPSYGMYWECCHVRYERSFVLQVVNDCQSCQSVILIGIIISQDRGSIFSKFDLSHWHHGASSFCCEAKQIMSCGLYHYMRSRFVSEIVGQNGTDLSGQNYVERTAVTRLYKVKSKRQGCRGCHADGKNM
jgi:hypothetical protein